MRTGIFGGSFNPVHNGHIHIAKACAGELSLQRTILVPSGRPPHKTDREYASGEDRYNMCCLAAEGIEGFSVSRYETERKNISYTVYTLRHMRELYPDDEFFLIIGSDMFEIFDKWYRFEEILSYAQLAVLAREHKEEKKILEKKRIIGRYGRVNILKAAPFPVSSTEIRKKIKKNEEISCYLNEKVVEYIKENNLYRE